MTVTVPPEEHELAADELAKLTPNDFTQLFVEGFRAYARGDAERAAKAFGPAYAYLFIGEDITADLASTYNVLATRAESQPGARADQAFLRGLLAAFDRLKVLSKVDRVALKLVLRLAAKVQCIDVLALLPRKVFNAKVPLSDGLTELRHSAFESVLALTYGNAEAGRYLRDIALTGSFDAENVDDLLFALCFAEPHDLLRHLILLEDALVQNYGSADTPVDDDLHLRRVLLLADIGGEGYFSPSVLGDVIDLALTTSDWRLSWIGRTLAEPLADDMDDDEREKAEQLVASLRKNTSKPARVPEGSRLSTRTVPDPVELREAFDALSSTVQDALVERGFLDHVVGTLGGGQMPGHAGALPASGRD